jgi:hypothetical protein
MDEEKKYPLLVTVFVVLAIDLAVAGALWFLFKWIYGLFNS